MQITASEYIKTMVRAGAGAGKTYDLIQKIFKLVLNFNSDHPGAYSGDPKLTPLPRLIVTTFTQKATGEVRERLLLELMRLELSKPFLAARLGAFLNSPNNLRIETIHGVLSLFLRSHGSLIGLPKDFKFFQGADGFYTKKEILTELLNELCQNDASPGLKALVERVGFYTLLDILDLGHHFKRLNPEVRFFSLNELTKEFLILFNQFVDFCLEAAPLLKEQIKKEGVFYKRLEAFTELTQYASQLRESKDDPRWMFLVHEKAKQITAKSPSGNYAKGLDEDLIASYREVNSLLYPRLCSELFSEVTAYHWQNLQASIEELLELYMVKLESTKMKSGFLEMDDLEILAARLIAEFPEQAELFSLDWDYWFVDEFQDTSPLQDFLLQKLIGKSAFYLVGDPQQSIYLFRGAREKVFTAKLEQVLQETQTRKMEASQERLKPHGQNGRATEANRLSENAGAESPVQSLVIEKVENRRSRKELLYFINDLFAAINSQQFSPMKPLREGANQPLQDSPFAAEFFLVSLPQQEETKAQPESSNGELSGEQNPDAALSELHQESLVLVGALKSYHEEMGVPWNKMAILCRQNQSIRLVSQYLRENAIPFEVMGSGGFSDRPEIRDFLMLLGFLINPKNDVNTFAVLRSPWFAIDDAVLAEPRTQDLYSHLLENHPLLPGIAKLQFYWMLSQSQGLYQSMLELLQVEGLLVTSYHFDQNGKREANLLKALSLLKKFEQEGSGNYHLFLELIEDAGGTLRISEGLSTLNKPTVKIMTVHASKGLEFDYVFLPYLNTLGKTSVDEPCVIDEEKQQMCAVFPSDDGSNLFPDSFMAIKQAKAEDLKLELERVFYVAVTRAREGVLFFCTQKPKIPTEGASKMALPIGPEEALAREPMGSLPAGLIDLKSIKRNSWLLLIEKFLRTAHEGENQRGEGEQNNYRFLVHKIAACEDSPLLKSSGKKKSAGLPAFAFELAKPNPSSEPTAEGRQVQAEASLPSSRNKISEFQEGIKGKLNGLQTSGRKSVLSWVYDIQQDTRSASHFRSLVAKESLQQDLPLLGQAADEALLPLHLLKQEQSPELQAADSAWSLMLAKISQGTRVHLFFEKLYWQLKTIEPAGRETYCQELLSKFFGAKAKNLMPWFLPSSPELPLLPLMLSGAAEWGFELKLNEGLILEGKMDLYCVLNEELWVIDYKTGSMDRIEEAFMQLIIYAWALIQIEKKEGRPKDGAFKAVRLAVLYPLAEPSQYKIKSLTVTEVNQLIEPWLQHLGPHNIL